MNTMKTIAMFLFMLILMFGISCNHDSEKKTGSRRDISKEMKAIEVIHDNVASRINKVDKFCKDNHVSDDKRRYLISETTKVGMEEIERVKESGFTSDFNPKYPELKN